MKLKQLKINYLWWSSLCHTQWGNQIIKNKIMCKSTHLAKKETNERFG